jgi:hypothetical protein
MKNQSLKFLKTQMTAVLCKVGIAHQDLKCLSHKFFRAMPNALRVRQSPLSGDPPAALVSPDAISQGETPKANKPGNPDALRVRQSPLSGDPPAALVSPDT